MMKRNQIFIALIFLFEFNALLTAGDNPKERSPTNLDIHKSKNWIIMLTINTGYFDFFLNWLWHFQQLQLDIPVVAIAEDYTAFQKLKLLHSKQIIVEYDCDTAADEGAADMGTEAFKRLVSARPSHILRHLRLGRHVMYSDTDSVWLRSPFRHIHGDYDIWVQTDEDKYCTGFLAIKTNNATIKLTQKWKLYIERKSPTHDQVAFNKLKMTGVRIKSLDTDYFPAGFQYFSPDEFSDAKRAEVVIAHNNYIVGHERKLQRFKDYNLWHE